MELLIDTHRQQTHGKPRSRGLLGQDLVIVYYIILNLVLDAQQTRGICPNLFQC